jgi:hypothetical protein
METYFIRHSEDKTGVDGKTRKRMWEEGRVFIHYPWDKSGGNKSDSKSVNPDDYTGGAKRAVGALKSLADEGGYVCAHYSEHADWLVGLVRPKSKIRLFKGGWTPDDEDRPKGHDGNAIIKTLLLHKSRPVSPYDYAALQSAQPRQGTIVRWPSIGDLIETIVRRQKRKITFDRLGAGDQEVICAEFLRQRETRLVGLPQLVCLLRDVGRTLKDLDILGIAADGKRIFAQVTHYSWKSQATSEKFENLKKFHGVKGSHLLFFCDCEKRMKIDGVVIFPIREVYGRFIRTLTGKSWKRNLL